MAKKQTRRSISVSRTTYERLKAFCETNHISMSQLVETRVNDFLGGDVLSATPSPAVVAVTPAASLPPAMSVARPPVPRPAPVAPMSKPIEMRPQPHTPVVLSSHVPVPAASASSPAVSPASQVSSGPAAPLPMSSAAARFAVDPPPPIIKPRQDTAAPKPAEKRPDQIFTF